MYAVKVVLLPSAPVAMPSDQRLHAVAETTRAAPQPGIAHVSLARWGRRLVGMTFVEAGSLDEALDRARDGWADWLSVPGLLPDWELGDCRPDRYLYGEPRGGRVA
ncbi:hypothetical protein [Streptomyces acidiscabies]|uniref:Uncharacterized protein n=1 Tax=Streptomyces acidiscabies TaxID=42234 RepID=A0A0L0KDA3_9ACTN|nr:hypothetical protein [Streptomyces acidiscabies]MBP5939600.1 hypothetical protein [Streptomyces sp. LBUM 1476]KND35690.1 hypothetical protein IQ63_14020 [Streptomyces acidiscabies]MBZ3910765.1 hypothetical protein [Streptomyces acidiscabies]MDX2963052.1 hypothetical protein [Streptomyces acidiscabies]MDX3017402.1 hypothetical protein [Streptomyces acidiscabies]